MKRSVLLIGAVLTIGGFITFLSLSLEEYPKASQTASVEAVDAKEEITVERLLFYTNKARQENGVKPLELDQRLNASAQKKAEEMERTGLFEHINEKGVHGYQYAREVAPECYIVSENIGKNISKDILSPKEMIDGTLASKPHALALLSEKNDYIGFGFTGNYYVEHFCDLG